MDKKRLVRKGYDQCAERYLADRDRFKNQKYLEKLAVLLKKNAKILDVGCGAGVPIDRFLVEQGYSVTGIDLSTKQIELAKKNVPGARFLQMDMTKIDSTASRVEISTRSPLRGGGTGMRRTKPRRKSNSPMSHRDSVRSAAERFHFPDKSFDAIVSFYAIFHIPRTEHESLLNRFAQLLKPGGYLLITMGVSEWEGEEKDFHGTRMFWSHFGREKNLELVTKVGFEVLSEEIDTHADEKHLVVLGRKMV